MNNYFNYKRFGLLCKNEAVSNYKSWGIYFLTIVGIYCVSGAFTIGINKVTPYGYDINSLNNLFPGFLFIGGYIVSSLTFSDINDKFKSSLWFSLPGSTFEKYLVGYVISSIGYVIFLILSFFVASLVSKVITTPLFGSSMAIFNPFKLNVIPGTNNISMFYLILVYILSNSIFLVGSIVFKKAAFIKTVLVGSIFQILISIILFVISYLTVKSGIIEHWDIRVFQSIENYFNNYIESQSFKSLVLTWTLAPGIIFCLFINVVGYFKLVEKEVKGGI